MKLEWKAEDVLRGVRGQSLHTQDWTAHGVSIDSRTVCKDDLFIAIRGDALDGHDYVRAAFDAGAIAAIVDKQPPNTPPDAALVFVDDTFTALQDLGRVGRARAKAKIIGITGSVGKTSTKEQLRLMLGAVNDTYANEGSLNNHWGVPLSLARLPATTTYGIFELGMNHAGEMAALAHEVHPDVAIITNVEAVHLEFFASVGAIADAKAEVFLGMAPSGTAVLNADNEHFARLVAAARTQGLKKILSFGKTSKSDAVLISSKLYETTTEIEAEIMGCKYKFAIGALGEHLALNALAGLLACHAVDADIETCMEALAGYRTPPRRGNVQRLTLQTGGTITIIDQTFNASPVATKAAIRLLGQVATTSGKRKVVALGDMKELGDKAALLHTDLLPALLEANIDCVHCCGPLMFHLHQVLPEKMKGALAENSAALAPLVAQETKDGDIVMVKGSKSTHMEEVVHALLALGECEPDSQKLAS
ncbi:MAG: UDP-N-acetylmuramoyl-tripeptide--D-alanyl-D-alanine ligase [Proteobacteria bacterium]|nr:UDP-N-acetylmuramoyl-tripeptide--D-alanyl-D-alanine ligase [Pseudomonadota bacterium]